MSVRCAVLAVAFCIAVGAFGQRAQADAPEIVLANDCVRYAIARDGANVSFVDRRTGKDYCAKRSPGVFLALRRNGKTCQPLACSLSAGRITVEFASPHVTVVCRVTAKRHYFVFEVVSVSDPRVDSVELLNLRVNLSKHRSYTLCEVSDEQFAACVRALNLQANARLWGDQLHAMCTRRFGLVGAKVALIGCPRHELRHVLKELIREEGLIRSAVGGPWALDAEEPRGSYMFGRPSEADVDEWIALAKLAGMAQIMFCGWGRYGDYQPWPGAYPHGEEGLKAVIDRVHAAGLKALMHMLSSGIDRRAPWVTPVPDRRLAKEATFTLASNVSADVATIPTVEPPRAAATYASASRGMDIQIDDEIMTYSGFSLKEPYGFTGCKRAAHGTKPAAHNKGAKVHYLMMRYNLFLPDPESTLAEEQAQRVAHVFNTCGFDGIYFDGLEASAHDAFWHYCGKTALQMFGKFRRTCLVEGSSFPHHMWPIRSEVGARDTFQWAVKKALDYHCDAMRREREATLLPAQLGWWAINGPGDYFDATLPDEIEYLCCKCLGNDMSFSLQGVRPGAHPPNARQNELLTLMGRYERLRLAGCVSEAVKEKLRAPGEEFCLVQGEDGAWQFVPTDYAVHKVTGLDDGSNTWAVKNRFRAQPVKLRIQALMSAEPYDGPEGLVLADFAKEGEFTERACAHGVKCELTSSTEQVKAGAVSGCFTGASALKTRRGSWAKVGKVFTPPLDVRKYRALGVWVHGDGKGELLNVQLYNPRGYTYENIDEHYIDVNFTGWRYFELHLPERDAERYGDYVWPYRSTYAIYRFGGGYHALHTLNLYYNNLPPDEGVRCYISPIRALPTTKVKLRNPSITIGSRTIVFPVELESRCYIEFNSIRAWRGDSAAKAAGPGACTRGGQKRGCLYV